MREIVAFLLLRQQLADAAQKAKGIRCAVEHVGQAQVIGMFIKMAIVIANKTDRAAADGIGLAVENVDPRPVLDDNNFMEIVVMLRKRRLREAWLNGNSRSTGLKEIHTVQYGHSSSLEMRNVINQCRK